MRKIAGKEGIAVNTVHKIIQEASRRSRIVYVFADKDIQKKDGTYRECPVFGNGAAFFSDLAEDYPQETMRIQMRKYSYLFTPRYLF